MPGKIDAWFDVNSPYSFFAFLHIRRYAEKFKQHGVEYEVHPVFINGLNVESGNKPPWTVPAKAAYGEFDSKRSQKYFGTKPMKAPPEFPINTLPTLRSLCYLKTVLEKEKFETIFLDFWTSIWQQGLNVGKLEVLRSVYQRHMSDKEVDAAMSAAADQQWKDQLNNNTKTALEKGAFGAPWLWVTNAEGKGEPWFGSDRFPSIWTYLGVPHHDFEVLGKDSKL